jgi:hypothetical protein
MIGKTDNKPNMSEQQGQAEDGLPQCATAPFERKVNSTINVGRSSQ